MKDQDCLNPNSVKTDNLSLNTKKQYIENDAIDIRALIRSIQRAEGNTDCFQMGMIDCDQVDCKWRAFCLEVYPVFGKDKI